MTAVKLKQRESSRVWGKSEWFRIFQKTQTNNKTKVLVVGCCTAKHSMVLNFLQTDSSRTATWLLGLLNICTLYPIWFPQMHLTWAVLNSLQLLQTSRISSCKPPKASHVEELLKKWPFKSLLELKTMTQPQQQSSSWRFKFALRFWVESYAFQGCAFWWRSRQMAVMVPLM